ncbi:MAG: ATP-dependent zinc metalloprotease FtsH, partial [Clostridiales bacterium]|nr:ATP-dependent zinc metalloprotease FtsH [Clostridiales bacterium]
MFAILIVVASFLFSQSSSKAIKYSDLIELFESGQIRSFEINDNTLIYYTWEDNPDASQEATKSVEYPLYLPTLFMDDVRESVETQLENGTMESYDLTPRAETPFWVSLIPYLLLAGLLIFFVLFMTNQMNGGAGKAMSFGRARLKNGNNPKRKITFEDVAGADEEKEEMAEIVEFLKNPKKFLDLGARIPRGVLLIGSPGTGKTYLAKAVAGEAGVPFFSISGSDFVELYVGVGASRVRDTFEQAKKNAPCIIFIDEIDAVGRQRGAGLGGGHDEREQTLNQLLVEMDGFEENEGVIVMAATNRPDILDKALLRPGRFDRQIVITLPDVKARQQILEVHSKKKPLADGVDLETIAKTTSGFAPADLENVLNEAALLAARRKRSKIEMQDIEDAMLKVVVGVEKKSRKISEKEKKLTAYHETGHAIVSSNLPSQDPVHQISIVPRGAAGGYTYYLPKEDKSYMSKNEMTEEIVSLLGGRVAESIFLDDISTGASNDIERATGIATKMVTKYGMSD